MGGKSVEHEVSLQSAGSIINAINKEKYLLFLIGIDKIGNWYLLDNTNYLLNEDNPDTIALNLNKARKIALVPVNDGHKIVELDSCKNYGSLDVVFSIVHGTIGEDGGLQGFFNVLNLPFIGADIIGAAVGMDKDISKRLLRDSNLDVADFVTIRKAEAINYTGIISYWCIQSKNSYRT